MPIHHGGKIGAAAKCLASKKTSKQSKRIAGRILSKHKAKYHK